MACNCCNLIKASAPARIVNVSSSAHKNGEVDFDNLQQERPFSRMKGYANSKFTLNLFTFELARRLEGTDVTCSAVNPGFVTTRPSYASRLEILIMKLLGPFGRPPEQRATPSVFAASASELEGVTGKYFDPNYRIMDPSAPSYDAALATQLWQELARLTGVDHNVAWY